MFDWNFKHTDTEAIPNDLALAKKDVSEHRYSFPSSRPLGQISVTRGGPLMASRISNFDA